MNLCRMRKYPVILLLLMISTVIFFYQVLGKRLVDNQNYYNLIIFAIWICVAIFTSFSSLIKSFKRRKFIFLGLFLVYIFLTGSLSGDYLSTMKYIFSVVIIVSPILISDYFLVYGDNRLNRTLIAFSFFILLYYSIATNIMIYKYPTIARQLASSSDHITNFYYGLNIGGGFSLVYGLVLVVILLLNYNPTCRYNNLLKILFMIFYSITILNSGYFIAIVITLVGFMFSIFNHNKIKMIMSTLFIIILILF